MYKLLRNSKNATNFAKALNVRENIKKKSRPYWEIDFSSENDVIWHL